MRATTSVLLGVLVLGGCGQAAPTPASPEASTPGGAEPTLVPGAVTQPPVGSGLEVTALDIEFEPRELVAPAGPVEIVFHNRDAGIPHTVAVNDASGAQLFQGEIVPGPADMTYPVGDLAPGAYTFMCVVHPNMTGTLTVVP